MTTLYLIRHAEAEGNLYRFAQGQSESLITAQGHRQIAALTERFRDIKLDALYSSDLIRTQTTATAITRYHELTPVLCTGLREICLGVCEGMSFGNMRRLDPEQMYYFNNDPDKWRAQGAETFAECTRRMLRTVSKIAEENDGRTVAIVSHGMAIRSLLASIMDIKSEDIRKLPHGDNTAVSLLRYSGGSFSVEYYNDNSHLPESLSTFAKQDWWRSETKGTDPANLSYFPLDPRKNSEVYTEYYRSAWLAAHGNLQFFTPEWFYKAAARHFERDPDSIVGIWRDTELIGILELDSDRGKAQNFGWISLICLRSDCRGMGLGIQPLGYAIMHFRRLGRTKLRLHVSEENEKAVSFYKRWGFEIIGTEAGAGAPVYLMEKHLTAGD